MKLQEVLPILKSEVEIQAHYQRFIEDNFKGCLPFRKLFREHKIESDGILEHIKLGLKILSEFKFKINILDRKEFCKCLIKILFYLKKIEIIGEKFPNIIFIANEMICYCFHSEYILKYLDFSNVDWNINPSSAWAHNPALLNALFKDQNISYYPFHIATVDLKEIIDNIITLNIGVKRKVKINMKNIERFFNEFINQVIINPKNKFNANELVGIFMNIINYQDEVFLHPKKKNILLVKGIEVPINSINYQAFFSHVHEVYTPKEGDDLNAICDRLITDLDRRFKGEFYTPTIWVDEAHRMIEQEFGPNWREEYVVWDPAWGTGNLTRDYNFRELYCSTINESDLKIGEKYNPNAVKFQYDFLNDDVYPEKLIGFDHIEDKLIRMAPGLVKALRENKKIIIFMNPPYTGPGNNKRDGISKTNAGKTKINFNMLLSKIGYPSCQLHTQFLFRILELKKKFKSNNINICFFTTPLFLTGESYESFRKIFLDNFNYRNGFLFNAGHFSKVKENWGISFLLFRCQKGQGNNFLIKIKDENIIITDIGNKILYNTDLNINLTSWCKEKLVGSKEECIILSNPIQVKTWFEQKNNIATMYKDSLGFIGNSGNNLSDVPTYMSIYSVVQSLGFSITKDNFYRSISMFCTKSSIEINWVNCKDEFCKPNENHLEFNQWVIDSIIYSIFHSCSQQSSLRNIIYKNKQWNIFNEFFWLPNQYMQDLANQNSFTELYQDAKTFNKDRFVYNELQKVLPQLSPDVIAVFNKANELVVKSFVERKNLFYIHPEWNLEAWDAGWYQIKLVLKEKFPEDLKEFRLLYRAFEDRMREGVYKFGFLK